LQHDGFSHEVTFSLIMDYIYICFIVR